MGHIRERIDTLIEVLNHWLRSDNDYLMDAIDRTAREGYFSFEDVKHAVGTLKSSISRKALHEWIDQSGMRDDQDATGQNVLCLHAGNLPLVGFQDALATLLSGARYTGKISRKDPYLLPTFLNEVKKTRLWTDRDVQWTHRLDDFEGMPHDAIVFAGSESSVPDVKKAIGQYQLAAGDVRFLIRTAHFSLAYLDRKRAADMQALVESIFRYGGKGCRSVAIVVSPFSLDELKDELRNYIKDFWLDNPQHQCPRPKLRYQYAYNRGIERSQLWLKYFLLQEGGLEFDQDFTCYWLQGDGTTAREIADQYGPQLQSLFVTHPGVRLAGMEQKKELLSNAQQPPISWKPDGVDTLTWLAEAEK
ncbi:acyl-CoA reductase [Fodinibius sediminis]|uniref:Acyl-CoA reductase (LuxC) n=1 Tax=Fodinibius sediminis TaxID=1214077 RepID=A0A521EML4_9BACT|nr:acyl-CoA reductase [Fodinibius sediminis]SMO85165.1 Acyl-CoA reductase (LuxC) [Fodinibius sediminis]